jgi:hypothetical protein
MRIYTHTYIHTYTHVCVYVYIYSLFWDVTQRILVVTDVSGQPVGPIFKGQAAVQKNTLAHTYTNELLMSIFTYALPPTTKNFVCFVNWCYMFRSCGPPWGIEIHDFKNTGKNAWGYFKIGEISPITHAISY